MASNISIVYNIFFKMNTKKKQALRSILLVLAVSCLAWFSSTNLDHGPNNRLLLTYLTSSTRSTAAQSVCSGYTSSDFPVNNMTTMSPYVDSLNSSLGIDGYFSPYTESHSSDCLLKVASLRLLVRHEAHQPY